jgi:predicted thioredoxin/glutaredoxin
MGRLVIVVHRTCASSYKLYRGLKERGLLGSVELRPASSPEAGGAPLVWSVPWLLVGGEPAGADPLPLEVVEAAVRGERLEPPEDPLEAFMEAILHSSAASSLVALNYSLAPALSPALAKAALHTPLTGLEPRPALEEASRRERELLEEWGAKIGRALASAFVRELWWSRGGRLKPGEVEEAAERGVFRLWLLAKASLGRAGLPPDPRGAPSNPIVEEAESFLSRVGSMLAARIEKEQGEVLGDEEWARVSGGEATAR